MELTERDYLILRLVHKFRFCLGRHVKVLAGFTGLRATDRRLRALVEAKYLARKKYMYGMSYLYTLTHKARVLLGVNKREDKIRIDTITHDTYVIDAVIYVTTKFDLSLEAIESEKELHIKDGFGARKHQPDFVFTYAGKSYAVEIELHPKTKERLDKNIRDNYMNYEGQVWITNDNKTFALIKSFTSDYSSMEVIRLEEVLQYVNERYN